MNGRSLGLVLATACGASEPAAPIRASVPRPTPSPIDAGVAEDARVAEESALRALLGPSSTTNTIGTGGPFPKGISNADACALVAAVPEVARLGGSLVVTEIEDFTDTIYGCTGGAGECLHWCRVDRNHRPWHDFAVDPHSQKIFVCRLADVQVCVRAPLDPVATWQGHGAP